MFKDLKLPFDISFMEAITLISFIVLGYLGIYRYSFYNTLGILWYLNSITPIQILISSFKILLILVVAGLVSISIFRLSTLFKSYRENFLNIIFIFLFAFWFVLLLIENGGFYSDIFNDFNKKIIIITSVLHYIVTFFIIRKILRVINSMNKRVVTVDKIFIPDKILTPKLILKKVENEKRESIVFFSLMMAVLIIITPANIGHKEALDLLKNRESTLNLVKIKSNEDSWYLMEKIGDKLLLIKKKSHKDLNNEFKLIEYKEVEKIVAPQKVDIDKKMLDYVSNKIGS